MLYLILLLSFLFPVISNATVPVMRYPSGTLVQVCQASDSNSSCGGGSSGTGNVGIGTVNYIPQYVGISTLGPSNIINVAGNIGIGSVSPVQALDVRGAARLSGNIFVSGNDTSIGNIGIGTYAGNNLTGSAIQMVSTFNYSPEGYPLDGIAFMSASGPTLVYAPDDETIQQYNTEGPGGTRIPDNLELQIYGGGTQIGATTNPGTIALYTADTGHFEIYSGSNQIYIDNNHFQGVINGVLNLNVAQNNVGIGTNIGGSSLSILGNESIGAYATNSAPSGGLIVSGNVGVGTYQPTNTFEVGVGKFDVQSGGNVGIGSTSPGQTLDVQGTVRALGGVFNGNVGIGTNLLTTAALTVMNGNVGIGTWSPNANLSVGLNGTTSTSTGSLGFQFEGVGTGQSGLFQFGDPFNSLGIQNGGKTLLQSYWGIKIVGNEQATGGGTINGKSGVYALENGNVANTPIVEITTNLNSSNGNNAAGPILALTEASSQKANIQEWRNNSENPIDVVNSNGNVGIGSFSPGQLLDVKGTIRSSLGISSLGNASFGPSSVPGSMSSNMGTSTTNLDVENNNFINTSGTDIVMALGSSITPSGDSSANVWNEWSYLSLNGTHNYSGEYIGVFGEVDLYMTGSNLTNRMEGGDFEVHAESSANCTGSCFMTGSMTYDVLNGTGTIAEMDGYSTSLQDQSHTNTLTNYVLYGARTPVSAGSTIVNEYGLKVPPLSGTTGNYAVYTNETNGYSEYHNGTAPVYIAGNLGIGSNAPGELLDVQGTLSHMFVFQNGNVGIGTFTASTANSQGTLSVYEGGNYALEIGGVVGNNNGNADFVLSSASGNAEFSVDLNNTTNIFSIQDVQNGYTPFKIYSATTNTNNALVISPKGNIGIGTLGASSKLEIVGGNIGISTTNAASILVGVNGVGSTSCLCKQYEGGLCVVLGTCT